MSCEKEMKLRDDAEAEYDFEHERLDTALREYNEALSTSFLYKVGYTLLELDGAPEMAAEIMIEQYWPSLDALEVAKNRLKDQDQMDTDAMLEFNKAYHEYCRCLENNP